MPARINQKVFSRVKLAREELQAKAQELYEKYMATIDKASEANQYDIALKHLQWLMEHMPADEDGNRMIEQSVDKKQEVVDRGPVGPTIQIGINMGGVSKPTKALPVAQAEVIDAE